MVDITHPDIIPVCVVGYRDTKPNHYLLFACIHELLELQAFPKKIVPNINVYVGMAVVWLTVPTLLPKQLKMSM